MRKTGLFVDLGPLRRFASFRRLWGGYTVSVLGLQITAVAVPYQIFKLTHSSLDVGLASLAQLGPLLFCALSAGPLVDRVDRRKLLLLNQVFLAAAASGLAVNAISRHPSVLLIFLFSALSAGFSGIDGTTRSAYMANLVDRESLIGASALWQLLYQFGQVGGPAIAGVLLGAIGLGPVYFLNVATFGVSFFSVLAIRERSTRQKTAVRGRGAFRDGLRYLRAKPVLQGVYLIDLNAMIFGMPRALFPALALGRFHGGTETLGLLYLAPGAGALIGAIFIGWVSTIRRQGLAVLVSVVGWGVAITAFGFAPWLGLAVVLLAIAGASDVISAVFRSTMLQVEAPEEMRGRIQSVQTAVVVGGPRLGDFEAGSVAALAGVDFSIVSGGVACLIGVGVLARLLPSFARYVPSLHVSGETHAQADPCGPQRKAETAVALGSDDGLDPREELG